MKLRAEISGKNFEVKKFEGYEELSFGYDFDCYFYSAEKSENQAGREVLIEIDNENFFSGIIISWRFLYEDLEGNYHYQCGFTSRLQYYLAPISHRIYKNMSLDEIIAKLFPSARRSFRDSEKYPYLCQYAESDLTFLRWMIINARVNYFFQNDEVIFFDDINPESVEMKFSTSETDMDKYIVTEWWVENTARHFENKKQFSSQKESQISTNYIGKTKNPNVHAGRCMNLGKRYLVTKVAHKYDQNGYENRFDCIDMGMRFAPKPEVRARIFSTEIATVTGKQGVDENNGAVKVQFAWEEQSTDYIPVIQPIAGNGSGFFAVPRVGQTVSVIFENGDPSKPIVSGAIYNKAHLAPYKDKTGYKTNDGEVFFHDKDSTIEIKTGKDMMINIGNSIVSRIDQGDSDTAINHGDQKLAIKSGDSVINIENGDHKIRVGSGNMDAKVADGNIEYTVQNGVFVIKVPKLIIHADDVEISSKSILMNAENIGLKGGEVSVVASASISVMASSSIQLAANQLSVAGESSIQVTAGKISLN